MSDFMTMRIHITNLRLRTYIGINEWEQKEKQDLVINISIDCHNDAYKSCRTDQIADTVNYKDITKEIIGYVESNRFLLLERLAKEVLGIVLSYSLVAAAKVRAEKPAALRFSDSVGVEISGRNE